MGTLAYDGWDVEFDDRVLTHLHVVIVRLFRNQESFAMSWINSLDSGDGRCSIWLHPDGDLRFRFSGSRVPRINAEWIERLTESARSSQGLVVTAEDGSLARATLVRSARYA